MSKMPTMESQFKKLDLQEFEFLLWIFFYAKKIVTETLNVIMLLLFFTGLTSWTGYWF